MLINLELADILLNAILFVLIGLELLVLQIDSWYLISNRHPNYFVGEVFIIVGSFCTAEIYRYRP